MKKLISTLVTSLIFAVSCGADNEVDNNKLSSPAISPKTIQSKPADGIAAIKVLAESQKDKTHEDKLCGSVSISGGIGDDPETKSWSLIFRPDQSSVYTISVAESANAQTSLSYGYTYYWSPPCDVKEASNHTVHITTAMLLELKDGQWTPKEELIANEWVGAEKKYFHRPFTADEAFSKYILPAMRMIEDQMLFESKK